MRPYVLSVVLTTLACWGCSDHEPARDESTIESPGAAGGPPRAPPPARGAARGAGRAWLEGSSSALVGVPGTWTIVYEAGPLGVAVGGAVYLQVSPFWGWTSPQANVAEIPGHTRVTGPEGITLRPATVDRNLLAVEIAGRALEAGEQIRFEYSGSPDRFAERDERLWIAVDGDGDGVREVLEESPRLDVAPGPPARLVTFLPSTARPGESLRATVALLDAAGSAYFERRGQEPLEKRRLTAELERLETADDGSSEAWASVGEVGEVILDGEGLGAVDLSIDEPGLYRLWVTGDSLRAAGDGLEAASNPLQVASEPRRVLWGDLQTHSNRSDGTALPEELLRYARDVARLDVAAVTDHDRWGMLFLASHPEIWRRIQATTESFHAPGRFVALHGFEWTHWIHGHRHVLYFEGSGGDLPLIDSVDPVTDRPDELWAALRASGRRALTVAHHSAGGPISTDWSIAPDPTFEPVTEIVSVHGASEALDAPRVIERPVPGNFVRDALDRGHRLGFLGSTDGHDGHPGLGHLVSGVGGLAGILAEEATRDAVYDALVERSVYATSGPRILLRAVLGGWPMGADVPLAGGGVPVVSDTDAAIPPDHLFAQVVGTAPIERIDLVHGPPGTVDTTIDCGGRIHCRVLVGLAALRAGGLEPGDYLYVRAVQTDGHAAWSSPWFIDQGAESSSSVR